ncbi:hypothetical protein GGX14DRAFT_408442 [Mycena pura]|uniref:Uncharacterized protein n=1 Tax=Mycena pura TaxID=153505 RepID=A0AAD6XXS2_9AGAR|nr:hypothetical protein GGX14DRAFT_408442 [Mycena pura]
MHEPVNEFELKQFLITRPVPVALAPADDARHTAEYGGEPASDERIELSCGGSRSQYSAGSVSVRCMRAWNAAVPRAPAPRGDGGGLFAPAGRTSSRCAGLRHLSHETASPGRSQRRNKERKRGKARTVTAVAWPTTTGAAGYANMPAIKDAGVSTAKRRRTQTDGPFVPSPTVEKPTLPGRSGGAPRSHERRAAYRRWRAHPLGRAVRRRWRLRLRVERARAGAAAWCAAGWCARVWAMFVLSRRRVSRSSDAVDGERSRGGCRSEDAAGAWCAACAGGREYGAWVYCGRRRYMRGGSKHSEEESKKLYAHVQVTICAAANKRQKELATHLSTVLVATRLLVRVHTTSAHALRIGVRERMRKRRPWSPSQTGRVPGARVDERDERKEVETAARRAMESSRARSAVLKREEERARRCGKASERAGEWPGGQAAQQAGKRSGEQAVQRAGGRAGEQAGRWILQWSADAGAGADEREGRKGCAGLVRCGVDSGSGDEGGGRERDV